MAALERGETGEVPEHLKDSHYKGAKKLGHGNGYLYPHSYPNHYVKQQYLPDKIRDKVYYEPGDNKFENAIKAYFNAIGKTKELP